MHKIGICIGVLFLEVALFLLLNKLYLSKLRKGILGLPFYITALKKGDSPLKRTANMKEIKFLTFYNNCLL